MPENDQEQRISDLEMRVAFQEDTLDKLSDVIAEQDRIITDLRRAITLLNDQLKKVDTRQDLPSDEPPPPHY
ncbi:SlyX family protein [Neptunomonas phycophila]|jgi:SlyX protein|uniref:Protein SlyX homolog n=1 Tax=Neptunomonas phycophila TaxID=1572645 RepID=A0AAW7XIE8_9GAMM|nr:SlyX family protein [Neptunomonas phycophila]MDO6452842.1 SlyX family protein [Neptunomonas phycophila]MDO6467513.1 SlyX family protein [Neptunomonas phycophila]MDP2521527.1 SlyX family protein [Neptunomonas phycophila]QLE98471.1 SlyX family protein [Neptunomonas phycophila]